VRCGCRWISTIILYTYVHTRIMYVYIYIMYILDYSSKGKHLIFLQLAVKVQLIIGAISFAIKKYNNILIIRGNLYTRHEKYNDII